MSGCCAGSSSSSPGPSSTSRTSTVTGSSSSGWRAAVRSCRTSCPSSTTPGSRRSTTTQRSVSVGCASATPTTSPASSGSPEPQGARWRTSRLLAREVLRRDLVEELLELVHDVLLVLDLVLELDRGLGDDVFGGEDRRAGADREGQGMAPPPRDL